MKRTPPTSKPPEAPPPQAIRVGFGAFSVELPKWLLDSIKKNLVVAIVAAATALNLYLTYSTRGGTALLAFGTKDEGETRFSKTFTFWMPEFTSSTRKVQDPVVAEAQFHKTLNTHFGGWTRWKVEGGSSPNAKEVGWMYQASLPKSSPEFGIPEIKSLVREYFLEVDVYVVELRHQ